MCDILYLYSCGCSSSVERQLPKLDRRVRLPSSAPQIEKPTVQKQDGGFFVWKTEEPLAHNCDKIKSAYCRGTICWEWPGLNPWHLIELRLTQGAIKSSWDNTMQNQARGSGLFLCPLHRKEHIMTERELREKIRQAVEAARKECPLVPSIMPLSWIRTISWLIIIEDWCVYSWVMITVLSPISTSLSSPNFSRLKNPEFPFV